MNILNVQDIERQLARLSVHAINPNVRVWVMTVARNYIINDLSEKDVANNFRLYVPPAPKAKFSDMPHKSALPEWALKALAENRPIHWFDPVQVLRRPLWQALETIIDWFNSFPVDDKRFGKDRITRVNFTTATAAAAMWAKDIKENLWHYVVDKPPVVHKMDHGYYWVRMITALHFEREGRMMNHCVGNGSYYERFRRNSTQYYSLRDKENVPHVTIEMEGSRVSQVKGNSNKKPSAKFQPYIAPFIRKMGWTLGGDASHVDNWD